MQSFMHYISHTKHNILKWKKAGLGHIDEELLNIQNEITKMEGDSMAHDIWHRVWLWSLYNRQNALLRQQNIY